MQRLVPGWIEHRKEATWESLPGFKFINRHAVLALFDNALAGLQAIHKQGLVHMDPFLQIDGMRLPSCWRSFCPVDKHLTRWRCGPKFYDC